MYKLLVVLLILMVHLATANELIVGSGVKAVSQKSFPKISHFNIQVSLDITIVKSPKNYYKLSGDKNIIDLITISSQNNELLVTSNKSFRSKRNLRLSIYSNQIKSIKLDGAMDLVLEKLNEQSLQIIANGTIDVSATKQSFVKELSIVTNGTVDIDFKTLQSKHTTLKLSGVGDIVLNSATKPESTMQGVFDILNTHKKQKMQEPQEEYLELSKFIKENKLTEFKDRLDVHNINIYNKYSPTLLYQSATSGRVEFVKLLLNKAVLSNYQTSQYHETALHGAIRTGKMNIAFYLIQNSKNLDTQNTQGDTPLHLATKRGMNSLINSLIAKGANKRIRNYNGQTPYDIAKNMLEIDKETLKVLNFATNKRTLNNSKKSQSNFNVYIGQ